MHLSDEYCNYTESAYSDRCLFLGFLLLSCRYQSRFRILQTYSGKSRGTYTICQHSQRAGHIICTLMSGSIYQPYIGRGTFSHWTRHNSPHTNFRTCRSQLYWYGAPWLLCQPLSATRLSHNLPAPSSGRIIDPHQWHFIGWRLVRGLLTHGQS